MFCPVCGNEYREGFTTCSECKVDLVESLETKEDSEREKKLVVDASSLLMDAIMEDEEFKELVLSDDEIVNNLKANRVKPVKPYVLPEDRMRDYLDSTIILLGMGGIGIIVILLSMFGVINLPFGTLGLIMFYVVMGGLFVIFILCGLSSMRKYINLKSSLEYVYKKEQRIMEWSEEKLVPEFFEEKLQSVSEDEMYFERSRIISEALKEEFPNLDESYLQYLVDKLEEKIFEE